LQQDNPAQTAPHTDSKPVEPLIQSAATDSDQPDAQASPSVQPAASAPAKAEPEPDLTTTQQPAPHASWEEAVEAYGKVRAGVAALLEHVLCLDFGDKVRLALDTHQERAIVAAERMSFAEWLGREVHWEPKADQQGESLSAQRARQAEVRQQQLEKSAEDDPHVQALKQAFDAKVEAVRAPGASGGDDIPMEEEVS
jgi:DNA polymerase-3 subunit gamma/tau